MDKGSKNKRLLIECPMCGKKHEVEVKSTKSKTIIKGEEVEYIEKYCFCENVSIEESEFIPGKFINENLISAQNAYRKKKSLLTTYEIINLRETYSLSQVDLANLLGWGEATISRYESRYIQDEAHDAILNIIKENPEQALKFLEKNKDKFEEDKYLSIKNLMLEYTSSNLDNNFFDKNILTKYYHYLQPSSLNGNKVLDLKIIKSLINCLAEEIDKLYKVKLIKMIWYIDFSSFLKLGNSMTGLVYQHEKMGALPIGHEQLPFLNGLKVSTEEWPDDKIAYHFLPNLSFDKYNFSKDQIWIINTVIKKFKYWKSDKIIDYMHKELAYKNTKQGELIPFKEEFKLNEF